MPPPFSEVTRIPAATGAPLTTPRRSEGLVPATQGVRLQPHTKGSCNGNGLQRRLLSRSCLLGCTGSRRPEKPHKERLHPPHQHRIGTRSPIQGDSEPVGWSCNSAGHTAHAHKPHTRMRLFLFSRANVQAGRTPTEKRPPSKRGLQTCHEPTYMSRSQALPLPTARLSHRPAAVQLLVPPTPPVDGHSRTAAVSGQRSA